MVSQFVHRHLACLQFADPALLETALADDTLRSLVLRVVGERVYLRPDHLETTLNRLDRIGLWYRRDPSP